MVNELRETCGTETGGVRVGLLNVGEVKLFSLRNRYPRTKPPLGKEKGTGSGDRKMDEGRKLLVENAWKMKRMLLTSESILMPRVHSR